MQYYWTCPLCGANLDPGEKCECKEEEFSARSEIRDSESPVQLEELRNVS